MSVDQFFAIEDFDNFSRIPLYNGDLDHIEGIVILRHILIAKHEGKGGTKLSELALPVTTVNDNLPVSKALTLFTKRREHIFVVKDKYDQMQGIVTLEDAVETLLGVEIMDEFDDVEDMQELAKLKMRQKVRK
jgi:CBS domain containing-hemolysin-like protein